MKYYLFLDDSGQLHPNYPHSNYFVYGGLLVREDNFHKINTAYKKLVKLIKAEKKHKGELKTSHMDIPTRRRLLQALSKYDCQQVFVSTFIPRMKRLDFDRPKDVVRFKNYMVRRIVDRMVTSNTLKKDCSLLEIHIDNQNVAHSSLDGLEEHLCNFFNEDDYYNVHKTRDTTRFNSDFRVFFKDSQSNYLVQAADLLANTMCVAIDKKPKIRKLLKSDYIYVSLP
ncbi:DUF3800 domain-containing protein [Sutcliffiella cohnii]